VKDLEVPMSLDSYLFEKACYVPDGLASIAEDVHLLAVGSAVEREVSAFLNVALRHGLMSCCAVAGAQFRGHWVAEVSRGGRAAWKEGVKPVLEDAIFGPDERDERIKASGLPREHAPEAEPREVAADELVPRAASALAALLDLTEIVRKHRCYELSDGQYRSNLGWALNGATKVLATLIEAEWDADWPPALAEHGRAALSGVTATLREADEAWRLSPEDLGPLDEAWLSEMDPERTPEAEKEAERHRRASVTQDSRMPFDLVTPRRYRAATLDGLLEGVPGHRECLDYARSPEGTLVIHGELASGIFQIQWAIGRHWFVDQLQPVGAIQWHEVVEDNLMAQNRGLWDCPHLLISSLEPVFVGDGSYADPCYAERMLEYRLLRRRPTVITIERYGWEVLNLRSRTVQLLKESRNVVLEPLTDQERENSEMFG
jgi:hypothetical protein